MKKILKHRYSSRVAIYDEPQWKQGDEFVQSFAAKLVGGTVWDIVAGGNTEALRASNAADQKCKWFTLFRHPLTRMVSAYFYCMTQPADTLCATKVLNAKHTDLATFAKHWGNFAMRQFVHGLVKIDSVMAYSQTDAVLKRLPPMTKGIPAWYLLKLYLNDQVTESEYLQIPDIAMYSMLQPVQDLLRDRYTVGIIEEFNTTLSLFNAALNLPGLDWHEEYAQQGRANVDQKLFVKAQETLEEAWTNSEIKKYMQLDIALYEHAVDVFRQQTQAHGVE